jgi:hypothetical protein
VTETTITRTETGIEVGGLWTYEWAARRRPFVHPVRTPAGHVLTRDAPPDHPWHHALWFTIKFVDGDNFWEEEETYGVLRHQDEPTVEAHGDGRVTIEGDLHWIRPDRETVAIVEHRRLTHVPIAADGYAIDWDITLVPEADTVLDRTPYTFWGGYGGLTVRGPGDLDDPRILIADGTEHQQLTGTPSEWLDLTGTPVTAKNSGERAGFAIFDHPENRRHPVPWYAATKNELYFTEDWTNFANAAFLWEDPMELAKGEELRIRHRVVVHDGTWTTDRLTGEWSAWTAG